MGFYYTYCRLALFTSLLLSVIVSYTPTRTKHGSFSAAFHEAHRRRHPLGPELEHERTVLVGVVLAAFVRGIVR